MTDQRNGRAEAVTVRLANRLDELMRLHAFFDEIGVRSGWTDRLKWDFTLSCEELLTNTITYGFPQGGEHFITLTLIAGPGFVEIRLEDEGVPFNPLELAAPDLSLGVEDREIGGLGVFFVRRIMNEVEYERTAAGNRVVLRKSV